MAANILSRGPNQLGPKLMGLERAMCQRRSNQGEGEPTPHSTVHVVLEEALPLFDVLKIDRRSSGDARQWIFGDFDIKAR